MSRGRPKLPEGQALVLISLRLPRHLVEWYDANVSGNYRSACMRRVLENYAFPDEEET